MKSLLNSRIKLHVAKVLWLTACHLSLAMMTLVRALSELQDLSFHMVQKL